MAGPIDPELVYLAGGYGGAVTGDVDTLYATLWQAFRNVQVRFSLLPFSSRPAGNALLRGWNVKAYEGFQHKSLKIVQLARGLLEFYP